MSMSSPELSPAEKHRRAKLYARLTYLMIVVAFVSVCAVAVIVTMNTEREKESFRAIHLSKPISFFDYTYVDRQDQGQQRPAPRKSSSDTE